MALKNILRNYITNLATHGKKHKKQYLQLSLTSVVVKVTVSRLVKIQTISSQLTTTGTGIVYQAINQFIYSGGCWKKKYANAQILKIEVKP